MTPIQLNAESLAGLRTLHEQAAHAKQLYDVAINATVAALGLDPKQPNHFDLDTGVLTPAAQE